MNCPVNTFNNNEYEKLKRKIFLVTFPFIFLTNLAYWLFSPYVDHLMFVVLPCFNLYLALIWLFIYRQRHIRPCEIISLVVFGFYHLLRIYSLFNQLEEGIFNVYGLWSPLYFVYIFLVLEQAEAIGYSLFIFLLTVALGIPHLGNPRANDILTQYYISTFLYILLLIFFQKIVPSYIESDMLRKNAYYDSLTDIANRRSLDELLRDEIKLCREHNRCSSIIFFDIDNFKEVNDEFGHDIGDSVLIEFVSLVKSSIRESDFFGRWGGDEFIVIAANQSLAEASQLAEKLRKIIASHSFCYIDHVTASFGVTSIEPDDLPQSLIKRADQALYCAKKSGKNTVKAL